MHLNTHNYTINGDHWNAQENSHNDNTFGDAHFSDIENAGPLPNLNDKPGCPLPKRIEHPHLNGMITNLSIFGKFPDHLERLSALPCDLHGNPLPPGVPPPARETPQPGDWTPFDSEVQFKLADLLYHCAEVSASNIDTLLKIWAQSAHEFGALAPFKNHEDMHAKIDSSILGDVPWQCMVTQVREDVDERMQALMQTSYEVWYHNPEIVVSNMLSNPDFDGQFDMRPYVDLDTNGKRRWSNVMSGNIAWRQSVSRIINVSRAAN